MKIQIVPHTTVIGATPINYLLKSEVSTRHFTTALQIKTFSLLSKWPLLIKESVMQRKLSHATTNLTLFTVSKDEWNTKEDTSNSMKHALSD